MPDLIIALILLVYLTAAIGRVCYLEYEDEMNDWVAKWNEAEEERIEQVVQVLEKHHGRQS